MSLPRPGALPAFVAGLSITIGAAGAGAFFIMALGWWLPAKVLLWPVWALLAALPCFNMGTPEQPACEGTPIHLAAAALGLALTVAFYALAVYGLLARAKAT